MGGGCSGGNFPGGFGGRGFHGGGLGGSRFDGGASLGGGRFQGGPSAANSTVAIWLVASMAANFAAMNLVVARHHASVFPLVGPLHAHGSDHRH
jgi:hypothetical protein